MEAGDMESSGNNTRLPGIISAIALNLYRRALISFARLGELTNILYRIGSFYILQVYDWVIPSRSVLTLIALSVVAATLAAPGGAYV